MRRTICVWFLLAFFRADSQHTDELLKNMLLRAPGNVLQQVLQDPAMYRCQVIYTQIDRDRNNRPRFKNFYFHYDPALYFNPASMVKLPLALLALEKLDELKPYAIDRNTTVLFDSSYPGQKVLYADSTAANGQPSIAHFIRRALLISENDPYNRLYQFVGQQRINRRLQDLGYTGSRITRQFMGFTAEGNRHTNALRFVDAQGRVLYHQPAGYNTDSFRFGPGILVGRAHLNRNDSLVQQPFDFTEHNLLPLEDLHQMLQSVLFPASVPPQQRFRLPENDRRFVLQYLSQYTSETPCPFYDTTEFYESYVKFFFRDSSRHMPEGLRVWNKVGWAYGFLTDVSYVADFKNGVEYMLSATLYVNSDGVLNDGKYDYHSIGYPFLYQLGQAVYHHELQRKRPRPPDLSAFRLIYEKRDPSDRRKPIREVDN